MIANQVNQIGNQVRQMRIVIARNLQSCGWKVRYRANQAGLGYDLEATRDEQTLRVEVKSSVAFSYKSLRVEGRFRPCQDTYVARSRRFLRQPSERNPAASALPVEQIKSPPSSVWTFNPWKAASGPHSGSSYSTSSSLPLEGVVDFLRR